MVTLFGHYTEVLRMTELLGISDHDIVILNCHS